MSKLSASEAVLFIKTCVQIMYQAYYNMQQYNHINNMHNNFQHFFWHGPLTTIATNLHTSMFNGC